MKKLLYILFLILIMIEGIAQEQSEGIVVLELFTSQGCSSCPPADKILDDIAHNAKENVYTISYHVDYWNRLGWKDPFSSSMYTAYQDQYRKQFKSRSLYTPQLVFNGNEHFVGSDKEQINKVLKTSRTSIEEHSIIIEDIKKKNKKITLQYTIEGADVYQTVFVLIVKERMTKIIRGENKSRTLKNTHIAANQFISKALKGIVTLSIPDWVVEEDQLAILSYVKSSSFQITGAREYKID